MIEKRGVWPRLITMSIKTPPTKISNSPNWGNPPLLNAILKSLNSPFAQKEDFLRKPSNISITFVYLCFFIMLKYSIKNHYRSKNIRLHDFRGKLRWNFPHATKKDNFWETILKPFWCSYNASSFKNTSGGFWDAGSSKINT